MQKILFLHGALGSAATFSKLIQQCNSSFECITVDFPGHSMNNQEMEFSIHNFSTYLINYIEENYTEPISVFGYSMGGYIALNALTQKPHLFNKIMTLATKFEWNAEVGAQQIKMLDSEKIETKIPHYAKYLSEIHSQNDWKQVVSKTRNLISELANNPNLNIDKLSEIEIQICVGLGDRDNMVSFAETEAIFKTLKNGRLYVIPNMEHPLEKANTLILSTIMTEFYKRT